MNRQRSIEEGWREKQRQRSSRLFGGRFCSIPCRTSYFASVGLEEMVEFILFFQIDEGVAIAALSAASWREKHMYTGNMQESS